MTKNNYIRPALVLLLSISLILFTHFVKTIKNPKMTPITSQTIIGLFLLAGMAFLGIVIHSIAKNTSIKGLNDFPVLGWVSIVSLSICLMSPYVVQAVKAVDFLSITTPVLAYAGVSVVNRMHELKETSWKIAIVAMFVFIGTFVGSAFVAQIGLSIVGR